MKRARILILAEDQRHERFLRLFLYKLGFNRYDLHFELAPPGRGSAEQFVKDNYARVVKTFRNRNARARTGLLAIVDADVGSVGERRQQFDSVLSDAGQAPRADAEHWACLVAKRNIETWIFCLTGDSVNEHSDYRRDPAADERLEDAASAFYAWTRPHAEVPSHCVDSLRQAIPEAQRIPPK